MFIYVCSFIAFVLSYSVLFKINVVTLKENYSTLHIVLIFSMKMLRIFFSYYTVIVIQINVDKT